jgi:hypothetical protein
MYRGPIFPQDYAKKINWRGVQHFSAVDAQCTAKSKYQSYWYGNAVALTICVNANALRFSSRKKQPFAPMPAKLSGAVPPRG